MTEPHLADTAPPILIDHGSNGVSRITFNRPGQRNAMNRAARAGIVAALDECRGKAKVIILAGNGPAFCAGMDLKEGLSVSTGDPLMDRRSEWPAVQEEIRNHPAIVIAAVHGYALGGGSTLINVADLAIAAEDAQIGMPEIGFGLYPTQAGPAAQLRLPKKRAAWMILTAERIDGRTAAEWGLVNRAVAAAQLDDEVAAIADRIARFDPVALEWSKKALWQIPDQVSDWTAAMAYGEQVLGEIKARSDAISKGVAGFAAGGRGEGQSAVG